MPTEHTISATQAFARDLRTAAVNRGITRWARVPGYHVDGPPEQIRAEGIDLPARRASCHVDLADRQAATAKLTDTHRPAASPDQPPSEDPRRVELPQVLRAIHTELAQGRYPLRTDERPTSTRGWAT